MYAYWRVGNHWSHSGSTVTLASTKGDGLDIHSKLLYLGIVLLLICPRTLLLIASLWQASVTGSIMNRIGSSITTKFLTVHSRHTGVLGFQASICFLQLSTSLLDARDKLTAASGIGDSTLLYAWATGCMVARAQSLTGGMIWKRKVGRKTKERLLI